MPSIDIKKYKPKGELFLTRLAKINIFGVIRFLIGALFIWSLLYFSGIGFAREFIVITGMTIVGLAALMSIVFNDGFTLPKTPILYSLLGLLGAVVLSGLFSDGTLRESFIGFGVEIDTVMFVTLWVMFMVTVSSVVHSNKQIFHTLVLLMLGSGLMTLFYIVNNIIFGNALSFIVHPMTIGILSVILVTLTISVRQFFVQLCQHNIIFNFSSAVLGIIGVVGLFIVHDFILWVIVGTVSLVSVTYALIQKMHNTNISTPWASVILFFMVLAGLFVGGIQQNMQDTSGSLYQDRPSFVSTVHVTRDALLESPLFGVGAHKFSALWDQKKPLADIASPKAHIQYGMGFGYFPTFIATTGIVGLIALVTFLVFFVSFGVYTIRKIIRSRKDDPLTLITWMLAFVMLVIGIMTVGDVMVMLVTAISFGLALAASVANGHLKSVTPKVSFTSKKIPYTAIAVVILLAILIGILYVTARSYAAAQKYHMVAQQSVGELSSINALTQVIQLREHDGYYRALSLQYANALSQYVQSQESTREQVQVLVDGMLNSVREAIAHNPLNYVNYLRAGDAYRQLSIFGIEGAHAEAENVYKIALERKPYSTDVLLAMAQLYVHQGNLEQAKQYTQIAFNVTPDQSSVYVVSAQIALAEDNSDAASVYLAQAARVESNSPRRWVDLGVVLFSNEQYAAAAESFARAITLAPNQELYYYLGLSLKKLGNTQDVQAIYDLLDQAGTQLPISNLKTPEPIVTEVLDEIEE